MGIRRISSQHHSTLGVAAAAWLLLAVVGCGSSEPFDMVRVTGKVTYDDGTPIQAARVFIRFSPQVESKDKQTHPKMGEAEVHVEDGTFSEATSHRYGDGLVIGRHTVSVFTEDDKLRQTQLDVSPSEIEVGGGADHFEFTVKRP